MRTLPLLGLVSSMLVATTGCTLSKTENPLTPTVAGPLPGVNITAPNPIQPRDGQRIVNDAQPVVLTLDNATSNSVRPFSYLIEVATDAGFANTVFTQDGVAPAANGRTTFQLPAALPSGKSYWWRAKAKDGANTGPYSPSANFEIVVPVVFQPPVPIAPINNVTVSTRPTFSWNNAGRVGATIGTTVYDIEVSEDAAFAVKTGVTVNEAPGGATSGTAPQDGRPSTHYFWRIRARDVITTGPWSATQSFNTSSGGGGGGGNPVGCHIAAGGTTLERAGLVVYGCGDEFPGLLAVFSTTDQAEAKAEELLLRTIWHLQLAGFQAARQKNPSGAISKDKLNIVIGGAWHTYDIYALGTAGVATRITGLNEVFPPNPQADSGIPD